MADKAPMTDAPTMITPDAYTRRLDELRVLEGIRRGFVIGPPKSGTTWLRITLGAHPEMVCLAEAHCADWLFPHLDDAYNRYRTDMDQWRVNPLTRYPADESAFMRRLAMDRVFVEYLRRAGRLDADHPAVVLDKTPSHALHAAELASLYPEAKFIATVRDVRDCAVSWWKFLYNIHDGATERTFEEECLVFATEVWAPHVRLAREMGAAVGPERYTEASYEDHIADPCAEVARLCRFLGVSDDGAAVRECVDRASFEKITDGRKRGQEAKDFFRKGVAGDWVNEMTEDFGERLLAVANASLGRWTTAPLACEAAATA